MGARRRLAPLKHVGGDERDNHDFRKSHVEVTDNVGVLMQMVTLPVELEGNLPFPLLCSQTNYPLKDKAYEC